MVRWLGCCLLIVCVCLLIAVCTLLFDDCSVLFVDRVNCCAVFAPCCLSVASWCVIFVGVRCVSRFGCCLSFVDRRLLFCLFFCVLCIVRHLLSFVIVGFVLFEVCRWVIVLMLLRVVCC